jgi:cyclopropane-fatty-acyl-phospholipid synthase
MYEHVGASNYLLYLQRVRALLRPGGRFLNDGIARLFSAPAGRNTFISRYVFPDGELHPVTALLRRMEQAHLEIRSVRSMREDYARTLRCWFANLERNRDEARGEVGEQRVRVWEAYILGSAHAFVESDITNYQVLAHRS